MSLTFMLTHCFQLVPCLPSGTSGTAGRRTRSMSADDSLSPVTHCIAILSSSTLVRSDCSNGSFSRPNLASTSPSSLVCLLLMLYQEVLGINAVNTTAVLLPLASNLLTVIVGTSRNVVCQLSWTEAVTSTSTCPVANSTNAAIRLAACVHSSLVIINLKKTTVIPTVTE